MLNDEWLRDNADRINLIIDHAETVGDGAAALGTLMLVAMDDYEFSRFVSGDLSLIDETIRYVKNRFDSAGIRTE